MICRYTNTTGIPISDVLLLNGVDRQAVREMTTGFFLTSGGQRRPCVSPGASTAGSVSVASRPGRGDPANASSALDGPTGQFGIFSERTQLLGQVFTHAYTPKVFSVYEEACTNTFYNTPFTEMCKSKLVQDCE